MEQLGAHVLEGLQLGLWIAAPALIASMFAGLVSGLLQAATQIQDASLAFVPRLLAVALTLALAGAWMTSKLVSFTTGLWRELPLLGT
jgi:flagellar biosynthesis protein FliQ